MTGPELGPHNSAAEEHQMRPNQARLGSPPTPLFQEVINRPGIELLRRPGRLEAEVTVDLAHTIMLGEVGVIDEKSVGLICGGLLRLLERGEQSLELDTRHDGTLDQVVTALAYDIGPDVAGRMHTARSRTDRDATILRLEVRNQLLRVYDAVVEWQARLLYSAEQYRGSVIPGYTHLQAAQPITFGHHLAAQFWLHMDDLDRLELAFQHTNVNVLGTASIAGTGWPLDRERTRLLLGFSTVSQNARVSRTYLYQSEVVSAFAQLLSGLHYLSSDLYLWSSAEFAFVEPADQHSGSSSLMPQKKNAYVYEHTRVTARQSLGWVTSAMAGFLGASSSDSFLEYPDTVPHGVRTEGLIRMASEALGALRVDEDRMRAASTNWSTASSLVESLVKDFGYSSRSAHDIVARLVRLSTERRLPVTEVTGALVDESAAQVGVRPPGAPTSQIQQALDPLRFVRTRESLGSTNPHDVQRQIDLGRGLLGARTAWSQKWSGVTADSRAELLRHATSLAALGEHER